MQSVSGPALCVAPERDITEEPLVRGGSSYYVRHMSLYPPEQRIPEGQRRLEILLPIEMVVELDIGIAKSGSWMSRSRVIARAVRAFIDNGGLKALESRIPQPGAPEQSSSAD